MTAAEDKSRPSRSEPLRGLESPFLDQESFPAQDAEHWQAHLGALEAENAFLEAFEQPWSQPGLEEPESTGSEDRFLSADESVFSDELESEEAGIIKGEDRLRVKDTTGLPWRWICKIHVADFATGREVGMGTGVLISNRHVLTAAHVVYEAFGNMQKYTITVIPGLDDLAEPFGSYSIASKPKIRREYRSTSADSLDWDYALLTLSTAIGEKGFQALNRKPLCYWASPRCGANTVFARLDPRTLNGKAAYTAGYPGGKGGRQLWCAAGILHSADARRRTMSTTADTTRGQSGSPVWVIDNKRLCMVGLAVGAGTGSNRLVRVTRELVQQLRAWIAEGGETPSMMETSEALEPPVWLLPHPEDGPPHDLEAQPIPRSEPEAYELPVFEPSSELGGGEAEGFSDFEYREGQSQGLGEDPLEERFDPATVPADVADALGKKDWALALKLAIQAGWRDENALTNLIFFARHPELPTASLKEGDPNFAQLRGEWTRILNREVWAAIQVSSANTELVVSGKEVTDHHRSFFRGKSGQRLKKLVQDAAAEVDLNPGLLGTIMMAETRRPLSHLSSGKVSTYHIGCDDFYEARAAIRARVPAYVKIKWDQKQTPVEHLNDARKNPRTVKTIELDSGPDAVLATAVYLKFREVRLREIAADLGSSFDALPLPTRFALTRMAMAAGTGGATPYLKDALRGVDIFVRANVPVRAYQTKRNATVRTAQAMHLSDWAFGISVEPATRPATRELAAWDGEQEGFADDEWPRDASADSKDYYAEELEEAEWSDDVVDERFESEEYSEPLLEELVPAVSKSDLRKRIDEYFNFANSEYTLTDGKKAAARSQFHIASGGNPERDAETIKKLYEKKFGAEFARRFHTTIRCATYGRARPDEIKVITQRLIDAGELNAVRDANPAFSDQQLIRALQAKFNIGIDCAGYVQLAFIYAFTGKHDDARCNLVSSRLRTDLGLKSKRSDENLAYLPAKHFDEVGFINGQTGDLLVLAWRKGERDWHTVIVVDHVVAGDVHTFLVDASWGFLYGSDAAGVARRELVHDTSTGNWWDIIDGKKVNENSIGPYNGHPIKGMYRGKRK